MRALVGSEFGVFPVLRSVANPPVLSKLASS
jgi:hypothetical protein